MVVKPIPERGQTSGVVRRLLVYVRIVIGLILFPFAAMTVISLFFYMFGSTFGWREPEKGRDWDLWMAHYAAVPATILAWILIGFFPRSRGEPIRFTQWHTAAPVLGYGLASLALLALLAALY